jgi:hypothetical protein
MAKRLFKTSFFWLYFTISRGTNPKEIASECFSPDKFDF